ncbi:hypothetical protein [Lysobacter enzymogenes]|uniref:Uncharacterized protein n=1 Tax=Lysobacter enzymogenes TaxID=69 RepID=A0AAU9AK15_LYSEN|nr:hypothetical protein [Lysobacter enzymogenes]BAV97113.1 hypothetical protein LEN_1626 [Lysobacter enzymogenes]
MGPIVLDGKMELIDEEDSQVYLAWLRLQTVEIVIDEVVNGWSYLSACHALGELVRRSPQQALPIVLGQLRPTSMILDCAFRCYYALDRTAALKYVEDHAEHADAWLFGSMLSEVSGDVGLLPEAAEILPAARLLLRLLRERGLQAPADGGIADLDVELFLEAFGDLE